MCFYIEIVSDIALGKPDDYWQWNRPWLDTGSTKQTQTRKHHHGSEMNIQKTLICCVYGVVDIERPLQDGVSVCLGWLEEEGGVGGSH